MHILLGSHGFPPRQSAGGEWQTYRQARWFSQHGHSVQVFAIDQTDLAASEPRVIDEQVDGLRVRRLSFNYRHMDRAVEYNNPIVFRALTDLIATKPPDIFHLMSGLRITGSAIQAARALHIPIVVTLTDFWFLCPRINLLRRTGELCTVPDDVLDCVVCLLNEKRRYRLPHLATRGKSSGLLKILWRKTGFAGFKDARQLNGALIDRRQYLSGMLNQADQIISASNFLADLFAAQGIDRQKIIVTRQGVDLDRSAPDRGQRPDRSITFGYIGQLAAHKGLAILIKAFRELPRNGTPVQLMIYGNIDQAWPPFVAQLKREIDCDDRIRLAGSFANPDAHTVYRNLAALIVPSIWYENSPNVILEAFACDTPVIASNLGGMAELVKHEVNGLLFEPNQIDSLKTALQRVIADPGQLIQWRRQIPPVKTIDAEMTELEGIYRRVLSTQQP